MGSQSDALVDMDVVNINDKTEIASSSTMPDSVDGKPSTKITFGVKRKRKFVSSSLNLLQAGKREENENEGELNSEEHIVTYFDGVLRRGDNDGSKSKNVAVVPLVVTNDWRVTKLLEKKKEGTLTLEEEAKLALLPVTTNELVTQDGESSFVGDFSNEDANFDALPLDAFGLAVLRGCGWKEGEGFGKTSRRFVPPNLADRRPKGLGLGNDVRLYKKNGILGSKGKKPEESLVLKIGSYVEIKKGLYKNKYGQVESFDEDNASVFVKLALTKKNVRVSQYSIAVISAKEYERNSKCINSKAYDEAKSRIDVENDKTSRESGHSERLLSQTEVRKSETKSSSSKENYSVKKRKEMWAQPDLKVRFVDKKYKGGKLYNEKVRVIDAVDRKNCTIQDASGKIYYQIWEDWLETVIPHEGSCVMVVGGRWRGNLAVVEAKEKKKELVLARFLHSDDVAEILYDDVCEWIGATDDDD